MDPCPGGIETSYQSFLIKSMQDFYYFSVLVVPVTNIRYDNNRYKKVRIHKYYPKQVQVELKESVTLVAASSPF